MATVVSLTRQKVAPPIFLPIKGARTGWYQWQKVDETSGLHFWALVLCYTATPPFFDCWMAFLFVVTQKWFWFFVPVLWTNFKKRKVTVNLYWFLISMYSWTSTPESPWWLQDCPYFFFRDIRNPLGIVDEKNGIEKKVCRQSHT